MISGYQTAEHDPAVEGQMMPCPGRVRTEHRHRPARVAHRRRRSLNALIHRH